MPVSSSPSAVQPSTPSSAKKRWICKLCGYVYEGEVPFEELSDNWHCLLYGIGKDMFELQ